MERGRKGMSKSLKEWRKEGRKKGVDERRERKKNVENEEKEERKKKKEMQLIENMVGRRKEGLKEGGRG